MAFASLIGCSTRLVGRVLPKKMYTDPRARVHLHITRCVRVARDAIWRTGRPYARLHEYMVRSLYFTTFLDF